MNPQLIIQLHFFKEILEAAHREGIDVAPLKGAHMVNFVYPENEDRGPMADVDFLVRENDYNRMCRLLQTHGYKASTVPSRPITSKLFHEHLFVRSLTKSIAIHVEPHRHFIQRAKHNIDYCSIWDRSVLDFIETSPCRKLTSTDHAAHACLHLETNAFLNASKTLRDIELLICQDDFSWPIFRSVCHEWGIARAAWLAMYLISSHSAQPDLHGYLQQEMPLQHTAFILRNLRSITSFMTRYKMTTTAQLSAWLICWSLPTSARYIAYYIALRTADWIASELEITIPLFSDE